LENLSDVEFGSDKGKEEAPILVAQRYLNIFRQVHIFNKQKRDQFDDELLALPPNITDFFKRMPGGRLLVEHIEEVKTERGISFVKSNREDFTNGTEDTQPAVPSVSGGTQLVGGNLVMDASFAETFANSMAEAFKNIPQVAPVSGGVSVSSDFGQAFELIAEEIRTSRTSLLDVLKETRNITDSVIASQVSISRILEGILSSHNRDETDTANLNNRIIASQASITKLLESLYTNNTKKNDEISDYLAVDNKLQAFRDNLTQTMTNSLQSFAERLLEVVQQQKSIAAANDLDIEKKFSSFRNEIQNNINQSLSEMKSMLFEYIKKPGIIPAELTRNSGDEQVYKKDNVNISDISTEDFEQPEEMSFVTSNNANNFLSDEHKKKKKKKKKKNSEQIMTATVASPLDVVTSASANIQNSVVSSPIDEKSGDDISSVTNPFSASQKVEAVIKNDAYKYDDDFSHINLDEPPLDTDENDDTHVTSGANVAEEGLDIGLNSFADDNLDFALPEQGSALDDIATSEDEDTAPEEVEGDESINLDRFTDDNLDFALPEQGSALDDIATSENEYTAPEEVGGDESINLDRFTDDNLDFALPKQGSSLDDIATSEDEDTAPEEVGGDNSINLDRFTDDNLDFALPEQGSALDDIATSEDENITPEEAEGDESINLDSFADDNLDFALPEQGSALDDIATSEDENITPEGAEANESINLDSFADDNLDFALPEQGSSLDDIATSEDEDTVPEVAEDDGSINLDSFADNHSDFALPEQGSALDDIATSEDEDTVPDEVNDGASLEQDEIPDEITDKPKTTSRYSAELDKIRAALTSDSIDISSLDEPIALDEYSDDENVLDDTQTPVNTNTASDTNTDATSEDDWEYEYVEDDSNSENQSPDSVSAPAADEDNGDGDWEWEYVDENGNPASTEGTDDEDWEWEYVEDENSSSNDENKPQ